MAPKKSQWKSRVYGVWAGKKVIRIESIKEINALPFGSLPAPVDEDQKFEFQWGRRHSLTYWINNGGLEERMLEHCKFILENAVEIQQS